MKVERGIAIPPRDAPRNRRYPFGSMKPGDSFFVKVGEGDSLRRLANSVGGCATTWAKRHGGKFTVRSMPEQDGVRVWCVARGNKTWSQKDIA